MKKCMPITQRAKADASKAPANQEVTIDAHGKKPVDFSAPAKMKC